MADKNKEDAVIKEQELKSENASKKESKPKSKPKKKTEPKGKKTVDKLVENTTKLSTAKERDMNEMVSVLSIVGSKLVYNSKAQQGYRVEWGEFLEENWIEYKELIAMRNTQKTFFERPWIICEWDVLEDLRVDQYYKNLIDLEDLDSVFKKSAEELEDILKTVPKGIQELIVDRAYVLIKNRKLDSLSIIETIEHVCKIDLTV